MFISTYSLRYLFSLSESSTALVVCANCISDDGLAPGRNTLAHSLSSSIRLMLSGCGTAYSCSCCRCSGLQGVATVDWSVLLAENTLSCS